MILYFLVYFLYSSGTYLPLNKFRLLHVEGSCFTRSFSKSKVLELVKIRPLRLGKLRFFNKSSVPDHHHLFWLEVFYRQAISPPQFVLHSYLKKWMFHCQNLRFTIDYPHCGCPMENIPWESYEDHEELSRPMYDHLQSRSKNPFTFAHVAILIRTMDLSV